MKLKQTSTAFSVFTLMILIANAFFMVQVYHSHTLIVKTQQHRQNAMTLVHDLRLQTYQLARLVQTYTTTGEPRYLMYYYDILYIRQGEKPRPAGYNSPTYWDKVIANEIIHTLPESGDTLSLSAQMTSMGFGKEEMESLEKIFTITEAMKQIEQIAFAATQGLYNPDTKEFVDDGKPDLEFASKLVHGNEYNKLNAGLSDAIEELISLTNQRTSKSVSDADNGLKTWILFAIFSMISTIIMVAASLVVVRKQVLKPIDRLAEAAKKMSKGDYTARMILNRGAEEFIALSRTFNSMAQAIEDDIANRQKIQRDLEAARHQAEEATRAKSIFLANMSHEIRTPMNAIIGMAYLVLRTELSEYQKDHIGKIHSSAQSLLGIINDILDFSKVEAGKLELEQTPFSLDEVIDRSLTLQVPHAREKNIEIFSDYEKGKTLIGDGLRLGQIITNLLSNAVKFTHQGYVRFSATCEMQNAENNSASCILHLSVEDTGIGMNSEQLSLLFKEFTQVDGSTTRKYGGTGLGLAISKRLTELMGGRIWAESEHEKGTAFHVEIPFMISSGVIRQNVKFPEDVAGKTDLKGMRVLLAEDNRINQQLAIELMNIRGVHADIAENGLEAIRKLGSVSSDYYDLVLMDIQMPVMDGYEATGRLRSDMRYDKLPIVAMTAHAMKEEVEKCRRIGMNDHVNKPIEPEIFYRMLERYYKPKTKTDGDESGYLPPTKPDVSKSSEFPHISGVNVKDGLRRLGGNTALYRKLLTQFVAGYRPAAEELSITIEQDMKTAERQAHTLKGLLGTIGAEELQAAAAKIEKDLKIQDVVSAKQNLALFEAPFEVLITDIADALDTMSDDTPKPVVTENDASTEWVSKFRELVEMNDIESLDLWRAKKSSLSAVLSSDVIAQISESVEGFDFDAAAQLLNQHLSGIK